MRGYKPRRPTGNTQQALFMQWVHDMLSLQFNNSSTVTVTKTWNGYIWNAAPAGKSSSSVGNFPFRIYVAQGDQLPEGSDPDNASRSFLVREGRYGNTPVTGDGMDGYDTDPDSDFFPTVDVTPVVIPDDADVFYFWIELTNAEGPVLRYGEDPTANDDSVRQWATYPSNDGYHIIIAALDIATDENGNDTIIIRQLLRNDIMVPLEVTGCDKNGQQVTYEFSGASIKPASS